MSRWLSRQETPTVAERIVVPIISWAVFSLLPLGLAQRVRSPFLAAGIGQFMLFRASAYAAVGGHAAIMDTAVGDMVLARRIKAAGLRWRFVDAGGGVACRMYRGRRGVVEGLTKDIFPALGSSVPLVFAVFAFIALSYLQPLVVVGAELSGWASPRAAIVWASVCMALALMSWLVCFRRAGFPVLQALVYPVTIGAVLLVGLRSMAVSVLGRVTWKGRRPAPDDTVA